MSTHRATTWTVYPDNYDEYNFSDKSTYTLAVEERGEPGEDRCICRPNLIPGTVDRDCPVHGDGPPVASRERVAEVLYDLLRAANKRDVASLERQGWPGIPEVPTEQLMTHCRAMAAALLAAGVFRSEAEVKAEALSEAADESGVNIGPDDGEWWKGYRQAQREIIIRLTERAAALRAGGQS